MKRFYKLVTTVPEQNGFAINLDGRPVKTPARAMLIAPTQAIADAVMQEWAAQGEEILPATMPLTQITSTCLDKTTHERPAMEAQILKYFDTDLLCYRATQPEAVGKAQADAWNPVIKKFETHFNVTIKTTNTIAALKQPPEAHKAVQDYMNSLTDEAFTILQLATPIAGSVITGILFTLGQLTPAEVMAIARVEERWKDKVYNAEKHGQDPLIEKADAAHLQDLEAAALYLKLL